MWGEGSPIACSNAVFRLWQLYCAEGQAAVSAFRRWGGGATSAPALMLENAFGFRNTKPLRAGHSAHTVTPQLGRVNKTRLHSQRSLTDGCEVSTAGVQ